MERKEWCKVLDHYIQTGTLLSEDYEKMDYEQQNIIKEIKLSLKRISYEPVPRDFINDKYKIQ